MHNVTLFPAGHDWKTGVNRVEDASIERILHGGTPIWDIFCGDMFLARRYSFGEALATAEEFRNRWDWHKFVIRGLGPKK